jgi:hypothetical protein
MKKLSSLILSTLLFSIGFAEEVVPVQLPETSNTEVTTETTLITTKEPQAEQVVEEPAVADQPDSSEQLVTAESSEKTEKELKREKKKEERALKAAEREKKPVRFFPIPDVSSDPTLGTGGGAMVLLTFPVSKTDSISPKSMVFGKATYYNTKSYIAIIGSRLYFKEDKIRVPLAFGKYRLVNEFTYGEGAEKMDVDFSATSLMGYAGINFNVWKRLYLGTDYYISDFVNDKVSYTVGDYTVTGDQAKDDLNLNDSRQSGFFINAEWDGRDNQFNPTKGSQSLVQVGIFPEALGTTSSFQQASAFFTHFFTPNTPKKNHTIVAHASAAGVFGDVADNNLATFGIGQSGTMRGYKNGKYVGEYLAQVQADYRWYFYKRFGLVGFAGVAKFFGDDDKRTTDKFLPTVGGGFRFMIDTKQRIALKLDAGWGTDENFGFYFGMTEAF